MVTLLILVSVSDGEKFDKHCRIYFGSPRTAPVPSAVYFIHKKCQCLSDVNIIFKTLQDIFMQMEVIICYLCSRQIEPPTNV